ncbi:hypothetical protein TrLO_g2480 [Triparma laevis f. longispina]|uniref:RanBP2-type domain-containing protein n=1 Tax=Triparma laevis f. longispina TaxID=1714387 RepID=A0A9W7FLQ2_9STRA|nr:hypothetical protein TrLO_g2480 [Triparma laevis f. longispina]
MHTAALTDVSNAPRPSTPTYTAFSKRSTAAPLPSPLVPSISNISNGNDHSQLVGSKKKKKKKNKKKKSKRLPVEEKKEEDVALDLGLIPLKSSLSQTQTTKTEERETTDPEPTESTDPSSPSPSNTKSVDKNDVVAPIDPEFPTPPPGKQQDKGDGQDGGQDEDYVVVSTEDRTQMWNKLGVESSAIPVGGLPGPFKGEGVGAEGFVPKSVSLAKEEAKGSISDFFTDAIKEEVKMSLKEEVCTPNVSKLKIVGDESDSEMTELDTPDERSIVRNLTRNLSLTSKEEELEGSTIGYAEPAKKSSIDKNDKHSAWNNYEMVDRASSPAKLGNGWTCNSCTFFNSKQHAWVCECCGSAKGRQQGLCQCENPPTLGLGLGGKVEKLEKAISWSCKACSFENETMSARKCEICDSKRDADELGFQMQVEMEVKEEDVMEAKKKQGILKKIVGFFKR